MSNAHHFDAVGGLLLLLDQETVRLAAGDVDPVPRGTGHQGRSNRLKVVTWILLLAAPFRVEALPAVSRWERGLLLLSAPVTEFG